MPRIKSARFPFAAVLLTALIILGGNTSFAAQKAAKAVEKRDFKGKWDGVYVDDQKRTGKGVYEVRGEKAGTFEVHVTWKDKDDKDCEMTLKGTRLGPDAVRLEGDHKGTTYRYLGRMDNGKLELYYLSINKETGESGSGHSTLTPRKK